MMNCVGLRPDVARRAWSRTQKTIGEADDSADVVVKILHPNVGESVRMKPRLCSMKCIISGSLLD